MSAPKRISRFGFVNTYLVDEPDGLTVIDTMVPGSAGKIVAAAAELDKPIVRILLTHAHGDHVGSVDALCEQVPDAELIISVRDSRLLRKDKTMDPGELNDKLRGGFPGTKARPDREIRTGDKVGSLEAVAAPGHTPGQLAFVDPRDGTLYCADAYSTLGGVATTAKVNPRFPLPAMATWHKPTALETARSLRTLNPKRLAPGHCMVVENPGAAMDEAIAKAS